MESTKRIQLLSSTEVEELYAQPAFNAHEQRLYFTLSKSERIALSQYTHTKTRIYFILQLGYVKAKQQFFNQQNIYVANALSPFFFNVSRSTPCFKSRLAVAVDIVL